MTDVDAFFERWLAEEVAERPVLATRLGLDGYDEQLGDLTAGGFERREQADRGWASQLAELGRDGLTEDQAIDVDLLQAELAGRAAMADWAAWRRDPNAYLTPCLSGVFTLFLDRLHPEPDLARFAAARLRQVPAALEAGQASLDPELASRVIVERALGSCRAGAAYARDLVPAEVTDSALRAKVAEAGSVAAEGLEKFAAFLADLVDRASGSYAIGEARYSALLNQRELLGYGAFEMQRRGAAVYDQLEAEILDLAKEIDYSARTWKDVRDRLSRDHPGSPEAMRAAYETWTERARQFLVERRLVTLPDGERCLVEPSPVFQRPLLAVASYSAPPPFSPSLTGHFFVPFPPEGTTREQLGQRLADNNHHSIPTISAHETYPGHHWHFSHAKGNPRPLRRVLGTSYFIEGWALYAERMMREQGFFTDRRAELCHVEARLFRAARMVCDVSLHTGELTVDEAVQFMHSKTGLTEAVARAEVGRYCSWPTQAASYLTGAIEIERIRDDYVAAGRGDLRSFHDTIAGSGCLPIALAERAVLAQ